MSDENKKKLNEQLIRCVLDDKLSNDKKIKKIDYIVKLGGDVNAECGLGYSVLSLAKMMQNDDVISFLEEKGAKYTDFNKEKAEKFFKKASVEEINDVLKVLPDGYTLMCDVNLTCRGLEKLPNFSKLTVAGDFVCNYNEAQYDYDDGREIMAGLTSLKGAPKVVVGNFECKCCMIGELQGAPKVVGGDFSCSGNSLISLEDAPEIVNGIFDCSSNLLKSLKGAPKRVGGDFKCYHNHELESLEGAPEVVKGDFICRNTPILTLNEAPKRVDGDFDCRECEKLKNTEGKPNEIGGKFIRYDSDMIVNKSRNR